MSSLRKEKVRIVNEIVQTRIKINIHLDKLLADFIQEIYAKRKNKTGVAVVRKDQGQTEGNQMTLKLLRSIRQIFNFSLHEKIEDDMVKNSCNQ